MLFTSDRRSPLERLSAATRRSCRSSIEAVRYAAALTGLPARVPVADVPAGATAGAGRADARTTADGSPSTSIPARARSRRVTPAEFKADARGRAASGRASPPPLERQAQQTEGTQNLWQYGLVLMLAALVAESMVGTYASMRHFERRGQAESGHSKLEAGRVRRSRSMRDRDHDELRSLLARIRRRWFARRARRGRAARRRRRRVPLVAAAVAAWLVSPTGWRLVSARWRWRPPRPGGRGDRRVAACSAGPTIARSRASSKSGPAPSEVAPALCDTLTSAVQVIESPERHAGGLRRARSSIARCGALRGIEPARSFRAERCAAPALAASPASRAAGGGPRRWRAAAAARRRDGLGRLVPAHRFRSTSRPAMRGSPPASRSASPRRVRGRGARCLSLAPSLVVSRERSAANRADDGVRRWFQLHLRVGRSQLRVPRRRGLGGIARVLGDGAVPAAGDRDRPQLRLSGVHRPEAARREGRRRRLRAGGHPGPPARAHRQADGVGRAARCRAAARSRCTASDADRGRRARARDGRCLPRAADRRGRSGIGRARSSTSSG